jgi:hypothetical protein
MFSTIARPTLKAPSRTKATIVLRRPICMKAVPDTQIIRVNGKLGIREEVRD